MELSPLLLSQFFQHTKKTTPSTRLLTRQPFTCDSQGKPSRPSLIPKLMHSQILSVMPEGFCPASMISAGYKTGFRLKSCRNDNLRTHQLSNSNVTEETEYCTNVFCPDALFKGVRHICGCPRLGRSTMFPEVLPAITWQTASKAIILTSNNMGLTLILVIISRDY